VSHDDHPRLTNGLTWLLALTAGLTVANIYYNQSLLPDIAREFHVSDSTAGYVAMLTQLGYAAGLLLVVPLADSVDRRRLILLTTFGASLMMVAIATAPTLAIATAASFLVGLIGLTPILVVAYGASLAEPEKRGHTVGIIMGGLLVGVLCSRTAAGFIGALLGWRQVFWIGAGATLLNTAALFRLPRSPQPKDAVPYGELLRSLPALFRREPALRRHALIGAFGFAAFSVFWTTLAFYLADRPEHYGGRMVGLFGLVAIAGAAAAPISGRLSDRHSARLVNGVFLALMVGSFLMMGLAGYSLVWLAIAVFLMDAGTQGSHISNQTRIMGLSVELRGRITSIYMVIYFLGGALGSAIGPHAWARWHWTGVWVSGAMLAGLGLATLFSGNLGRHTRHQPIASPVS
jgi:predicted MFS family arabinose efflux permease